MTAPTTTSKYIDGGADDVPCIPNFLAALAVACPKCKSVPDFGCVSTGGGNGGSVVTHKARIDRVRHWTNRFMDRAEQAYRTGHRLWWAGGDVPAGLFDEFEQAATPIVVKAKPTSPKGVQLSEKQAEYVEYAAQGGGILYAPTAHFHGDHQARQAINALEAKGIVEFVKYTNSGYNRLMRLTSFGWQVYRQHRLIIRRLPAAEVDALEAQALKRCQVCGGSNGPECDECFIAEDVRAARREDQ